MNSWRSIITTSLIVLEFTCLIAQRNEDVAEKDSIIQAILEESGQGIVEEVDQPDLSQHYEMQPASGGLLMTTLWRSGYQKIGVKQRLRMKTGNRWQLRFTAEQDPGENWRGYPDHLSAGLLVTPNTWIEQLAVGDYQLNLGFGANIWSSRRYEFLLDQPSRINRVGQGLRLHSGGDENIFLRGIAVRIRMKDLKITLFFSAKRVDARLEGDPQIKSDSVLIRALKTTGYHRTETELMDRKSLPEELTGFGLEYEQPLFLVGVTGLMKSLRWFYESDRIMEHSYARYPGVFYRFGMYGKIRCLGGVAYGEMAFSQDRGIGGLVGFRSYSFHSFSLAFRLQMHSNGLPMSYSIFSEGKEFSGRQRSGKCLISYQPRGNIQINAGFLYSEEKWFTNRTSSGPIKASMKLQIPVNELWLLSSTLYSKGLFSGSEDESFQIKTKIAQKYDVNNQFALQFGLTVKFLSAKLSNPGSLAFAECRLVALHSKLLCKLGCRVYHIPARLGRLYEYEPDVHFAFSIPSYSNSGIRTYILMQYRLVDKIRFEGKLWGQNDSDKWGCRIQCTIGF